MNGVKNHANRNLRCFSQPEIVSTFNLKAINIRNISIVCDRAMPVSHCIKMLALSYIEFMFFYDQC